MWDGIGCSLISSWQLVSTTSATSMAPELHCASPTELDAWAQYTRGVFNTDSLVMNTDGKGDNVSIG